MARHLLVGILGAVLGAVAGYVVALVVAGWWYRDCGEMDCLTVYLFAFVGGVIGSIVLAVILVMTSVRRTRSEAG